MYNTRGHGKPWPFPIKLEMYEFMSFGFAFLICGQIGQTAASAAQLLIKGA